MGKKGNGKFAEISWDDALDDISQRFSAVAEQYGGEALWLYYFARTMVLLMRDSINRLARAKGLFWYVNYHLRQSYLDRIYGWNRFDCQC